MHFLWNNASLSDACFFLRTTWYYFLFISLPPANLHSAFLYFYILNIFINKNRNSDSKNEIWFDPWSRGHQSISEMRFKIWAKKALFMKNWKVFVENLIGFYFRMEGSIGQYFGSRTIFIMIFGHFSNDI